MNEIDWTEEWYEEPEEDYVEFIGRSRISGNLIVRFNRDDSCFHDYIRKINRIRENRNFSRDRTSGIYYDSYRVNIIDKSEYYFINRHQGTIGTPPEGNSSKEVDYDHTKVLISIRIGKDYLMKIINEINDD